LYAINASYVFQYDLQATDIAASKTLVAEWDGYVHEISFATTFAAAQLAPDGKIYICTAFSTPFLHVIEYPDRKGIACQLRQRAIHLPNYNNYSIPNFPNYRLGPIDGSVCDTLGLDNHPLCNWRWEQEDTLAPLKITFTDLSSYVPTEWHWGFGDGTVSQDTSPVHTYTAEGTYNVCLVVSNQYSADTFCQLIQLGISATHNLMVQNQIMVSPNPFQERLTVS
jgi:PKD domain